MESVLGNILGPVIGILGRFIPDANARAQAQEEITKQILANEASILASARDVVSAEIGSGNKLASSWRPVLMYLLMALIVWFVAVAPIFGLVADTREAVAAVPAELWTLLQIGMGGYILARSGEKIAASIAGPKGRAR